MALHETAKWKKKRETKRKEKPDILDSTNVLSVDEDRKWVGVLLSQSTSNFYPPPGYMRARQVDASKLLTTGEPLSRPINQSVSQSNIK